VDASLIGRDAGIAIGNDDVHPEIAIGLKKLVRNISCDGVGVVSVLGDAGRSIGLCLVESSRPVMNLTGCHCDRDDGLKNVALVILICVCGITIPPFPRFVVVKEIKN
jgi:hypothetical protein